MDKSRNEKGQFIVGHEPTGVKKGFKNPKGSLAKIGVKNPMFGKIKENPSYPAIHSYIRKRLVKPLACEHCGEQKPLDMANKSHNYKRDLSDWMWLCRRCHQRYDGNYPPRKKSGGKLTDSHRAALSKAHMGQTPWNKGKKLHYKVWNAR